MLMAAILPVLCSIGGEAFRWQEPAVESDPRVMVQPGSNLLFGITILKDDAGKPVNKQLTYSKDGATNNTVVRIDGKDLQPGASGRWIEERKKSSNGFRWIWEQGGVKVTQDVEVVAGTQPTAGTQRRLLNTCLVRIRFQNDGAVPANVGIRLQVDTLIGVNDGVPFAVPGVPGLVTTFKDFATPSTVPDFIEALEKPDLKDPGTVGHFSLKIGGGLEAPSRVSLTHWPGSFFKKWDVPLADLAGDSAVVLYWNEQPLAPGQSRDLGFSYGLGSGAGTGSAGDGLRLTLDGAFEEGQSFSALAYVQNPKPGQSVTLILPPELERTRGNAQENVPPPGANSNNTSTISWAVTAKKPGKYHVDLTSSSGSKVSREIIIAPSKTPSAKVTPPLLTLNIVGTPMVGKTVSLEAKVEHPAANQRLTAMVPAGLSLAEGAADRYVPTGDAKVAWLLRIDRAGEHSVEVKSNVGESKKIAVHALTPVPPLSGPVTVLDAQKALKMSVNLIPVDLAYDLDRDGQVTSRDAVLIMRKAITGP